MARTGVEEKIYRSALELLRSRGPVGVSIESVSAASGVAKTTIYRRFDNSESLLAAAVASATAPVSLPDDLSATETLRWALQHARAVIEDVVGRGTLAAILGGDDPQVSGPLLGMVRASLDPLRSSLHAHIARGDLRSDLDVELTVTVLMGAVIAELIRGRQTDDAWVEEVLGLLWPGLAPLP